MNTERQYDKPSNVYTEDPQSMTNEEILDTLIIFTMKDQSERDKLFNARMEEYTRRLDEENKLTRKRYDVLLIVMGSIIGITALGLLVLWAIG